MPNKALRGAFAGPNRRHLERVLRAYLDHYNRKRPHRSLELRPPEQDNRPQRSHEGEIRRRERLCGLIHEYYRAAASGATRMTAPFRDAVDGLVGPDDYPNLIEALVGRGSSEGEVTAIADGNLLRLLDASLPARS